MVPPELMLFKPWFNVLHGPWAATESDSPPHVELSVPFSGSTKAVLSTTPEGTAQDEAVPRPTAKPTIPISNASFLMSPTSVGKMLRIHCYHIECPKARRVKADSRSRG